jgi:hypothetical protein
MCCVLLDTTVEIKMIGPWLICISQVRRAEGHICFISMYVHTADAETCLCTMKWI